MKKSILIGAIAALMLFAFVACDNSGATVESKIITQIEVTSEVPSLFKGEDLSESDITVVATALDGSTFTVPASDLTVVVDTDGADVKVDSGEATKIGTVAYTGYNYGSLTPVTADVEAIVYTMDNIKVTGPATPAAFYFVQPTTGAAVKFHTEYDPSLYTVTAEAIDDEDGTTVLFSRPLVYSKTAADTEYSVEIAKKTANAATSEAGTITFEVSTAFGSVASQSVEILCQPDNVKSVTLAVKDGKKFVGGVAATTYEKAEYFDATAVYESGYTEAITDTYSIAFDQSSLTQDSKLPAAPGAATVSATYKNVKSNVVTVTTVSDYIVSYTASYTESATVKATEKVQKDLVKFDITWASGATTPSTFKPSFTISDNDGTMPNITGSYVFSVVLTNTEAADATTKYALLSVPVGSVTTTKDSIDNQ